MLDLMVLTAAYLLGSVSSAIIACQLLQLPDPRTQGSKNAGATNVLRIGGKRAAAVVLVVDIAKGMFAVLLARFLGVQGLLLGLCALAVVVGHIFPVFYGFKGGKGVATLVGATFALNVIAGAVVAAIWGVVAKFSHYSSLASVIAVAAAPILIVIFANKHFFAGLLLASILVLVKHWDNILRLIEGDETKIGQ